jgi:hypothetical protein
LSSVALIVVSEKFSDSIEIGFDSGKGIATLPCVAASTLLFASSSSTGIHGGPVDPVEERTTVSTVGGIDLISPGIVDLLVGLKNEPCGLTPNATLLRGDGAFQD